MPGEVRRTGADSYGRLRWNHQMGKPETHRSDHTGRREVPMRETLARHSPETLTLRRTGRTPEIHSHPEKQIYRAQTWLDRILAMAAVVSAGFILGISPAAPTRSSTAGCTAGAGPNSAWCQVRPTPEGRSSPGNSARAIHSRLELESPRLQSQSPRGSVCTCSSRPAQPRVLTPRRIGGIFVASGRPGRATREPGGVSCRT